MSQQLFKKALALGLEKQVPLKEPAKARILVAEDMPTEALEFNNNLRALGYEVDIALDGVEAIQKVQQYAGYDAILMNFLMPRVNGFRATAFIRDVLKYEGPIIGFSLTYTSDYVRASARAGMNTYIFSGDGKFSIIKALEIRLRKAAAKKAESLVTK